LRQSEPEFAHSEKLPLSNQQVKMLAVIASKRDLGPDTQAMLGAPKNTTRVSPRSGQRDGTPHPQIQSALFAVRATWSDRVALSTFNAGPNPTAEAPARHPGRKSLPSGCSGNATSSAPNSAKPSAVYRSVSRATPKARLTPTWPSTDSGCKEIVRWDPPMSTLAPRPTPNDALPLAPT